ncbi:MAG: RecQ family ATP-dependent DNA helicase [Bacteroidota bacterium]
MNNKILYLDLETTQDGKIKDIGALFQIYEFHENNITKLEQWISQTKYICGHNIAAHDIPLLKQALGSSCFEGKIIIDTLLWSPILFSNNPYHKLVKGYKIVNDSDYNNPLSDCKLTRQLLLEEMNAFEALGSKLQQIFVHLLNDADAYSGFFQLLNFETAPIDLENEIKSLFEQKFCQRAPLTRMIHENPIELAYALALINTKENNSISPNWVRQTYPKTQELIYRLRFHSCSPEECDYCSTHLNPKKALATYFGYPDFRSFDENESISLQEKTVRAGLSSDSFVAVFPTGGGKSLTFQLPALMKGDATRQLTVVISPLVSLMKDQVENLENRFSITKAVAINGLLSPLERQEALERVESGDIHLLYLSPESLRSRTILRLLRKRSIARFVIDEAHCFSSWGQDFRVDYLYIADFIRTLEGDMLYGRIPVSCFTATAKPQVIEDIKLYFRDKLEITLDEYITRASRTNLHYEVIDIENPASKMPTLINLLSKCEMPTIIYAARTKKVEEINESLNKAGFESTFFHGQLDKEVKKVNMDDFMEGNKDIIVATSAFGMGVDKDDVKTVIHFNISDSLENYVQEAGRAGRNENIQARCYVLFHEADLNKHFSLLRQTKLNIKEIQQIWQGIKYLSKFRKNQKISKSALEIAKEAGWDTELRELGTRVRMSVAALENQGFLKRTQNSTSVFADSLLVPKIDKALTIINSSSILTEPQRQQCVRVLQRIVKDEECRIDYLAEVLAVSVLAIRETIEHLRDHEILGDARDLTAFLNLTQSKNNSKKILARYLELEKALLQQLQKNAKITLRQLNQNIIDSGTENSSIDAILNLLNYREIRRFMKKKRVDRETNLYDITIQSPEIIAQDISWRHDLSVDVFNLLVEFQNSREDKTGNPDKKSLPVGFSMLEVKNKNQLLGQIKEHDIKRYEKTLLFLNKIKSIQLEGGFMVYYNRLNLEHIDRSKRLFTKADFEKIGTHYDHKTQQIHIVGEYAKRRLQNYQSALTFVNDYFSLEYDAFLKKYFPRRKEEIQTPLTPNRFKEIVGTLDTDQTKIVKDGKSKNILVLAGPGSGKTKVLVHKIASLLLLEDIKPEQFLMLTFSKAASLEFKARAFKLVREYAGFIKITTFHGFCFQLLGVLGDLKKSENVIKDCISAIENEEIDISSIVNKSVLLLDEFQDVNQEEWQLIQTIVKVAGNLRVIAVGDDDQNIYKFRGSSNQYMREFSSIYADKAYTLVKNYRSRSNIVHFNNQWLQYIPDRLKSQPLEAVQKENSDKIEIICYNGSHLEMPLVKKLIQDDFDGSRTVLVRTNDEALKMHTFLKDAGLKSKLVAGLEGFSLANLWELRTFTDYLTVKKNVTGLITKSVWNDAKRHFHNQHKDSKHYDLCKEVILKFEHAFADGRLLELIEWYDYIREIKMENIIEADKDVVFVSTMHKSKGKEFDHVYLLMDDFQFNKDESKRLFYVACSRAKKNLQLHTNDPRFKRIKSAFVKHTFYNETLTAPKHFELLLGHKDINLGSLKYSQKITRTLKTGEHLILGGKQFDSSFAPGLDLKHSGNVLLFSRLFLEKKLDKFRTDGYKLTDSVIEYLVYWYDKESEQEYKIVLPKLHFEMIEDGRNS